MMFLLSISKLPCILLCEETSGRLKGLQSYDEKLGIQAVGTPGGDCWFQAQK